MNARLSLSLAAVSALAIGSGFLLGYPAQVAAATAIAGFGAVAMLTIRDLAASTCLPTRPRKRTPDSAALEQLRQINEALAASRLSRFGIDRDLRPLLRPIAAMRLDRRGVNLDHNPDEARGLLGEALWDLVRTDLETSSNLRAGGLSSTQLQGAIEHLEQV